MADLDDFFAKKDRKKSKGKKFITTEEIAKKMEEVGKKMEKSNKYKFGLLSVSLGTEGDDMRNSEEDDEWKMFKEEKKDYTGLKIQNLNLQDIEDGDKINDKDNDKEDKDDNFQNNVNLPKMSPWKVVDNKDEAETAEPKENKESPAPVKKSYVLPQLRNQGRERIKLSSKPQIPDITNQKNFPTLSAKPNNEPAPAWNKRKQEAKFEEVRNSRSHSSRSDSTATPQALPVENKFGALETENS